MEDIPKKMNRKNMQNRYQVMLEAIKKNKAGKEIESTGEREKVLLRS